MLAEGTHWAALVGAKPAKLALPRNADVLPVAMITPSPASIIDGAVRRTRCSKAMTLI
jgi:hypothetical protein